MDQPIGPLRGCPLRRSYKNELGVFFVGRLSSYRKLKMYYCNGKGVQKCVLCWEVVSFSEGPFIGGSTATHTIVLRF